MDQTEQQTEQTNRKKVIFFDLKWTFSVLAIIIIAVFLKSKKKRTAYFESCTHTKKQMWMFTVLKQTLNIHIEYKHRLNSYKNTFITNKNSFILVDFFIVFKIIIIIIDFMKIIINIDDHFSIVDKILKQMKIIIMNELVINPNTHIIYCVFSLYLMIMMIILTMIILPKLD